MSVVLRPSSPSPSASVLMTISYISQSLIVYEISEYNYRPHVVVRIHNREIICD